MSRGKLRAFLLFMAICLPGRAVVSENALLALERRVMCQGIDPNCPVELHTGEASTYGSRYSTPPRRICQVFFSQFLNAIFA